MCTVTGPCFFVCLQSNTCIFCIYYIYLNLAKEYAYVNVRKLQARSRCESVCVYVAKRQQGVFGMTFSPGIISWNCAICQLLCLS